MADRRTCDSCNKIINVNPYDTGRYRWKVQKQEWWGCLIELPHKVWTTVDLCRGCFEGLKMKSDA